MSCYICERCEVIENTALGDYWYRKYKEHKEGICSECSTGKWHGQFEKKHWTDYGMEKLIEYEKRDDGSMINATEYFKSLGK